MNQDPEVYSRPHLFEPQRFMQKSHNDDTILPDPKKYIFGFGDRKCPGEQFADSNISLVFASMIATLKISKALDEEGNEITPNMAFASSTVR